MDKSLEYYLGLPYTIELRNFPREGCFARVKELAGCLSQGDTVDEAVANIQEAMQLWLEVSLDHGDPIPEPRAEEEYSGKFVVRVPRSLHRDLVEAANQDGVSLNQYINVALAQVMGGARSTEARSLPNAISEQAQRLESLIDRLENGQRVARPALGAATGRPVGEPTLAEPRQPAVHEEQVDYKAPEGGQTVAKGSEQERSPT